VFLGHKVNRSAHLYYSPPLNMPPTTPPLDFDHKPGYEIPTKHKEAIRQLYGFAKVPIELLMDRYHLGRLIIVKVLD
jgi:hypothetical protein